MRYYLFFSLAGVFTAAFCAAGGILLSILMKKNMQCDKAGAADDAEGKVGRE